MAATAVLESFYVDDGLSGADIESACYHALATASGLIHSWRFHAKNSSESLVLQATV